jgi:hypothetical protein
LIPLDIGLSGIFKAVEFAYVESYLQCPTKMADGLREKLNRAGSCQLPTERHRSSYSAGSWHPSIMPEAR